MVIITKWTALINYFMIEVSNVHIPLSTNIDFQQLLIVIIFSCTLFSFQLINLENIGKKL